MSDDTIFALSSGSLPSGVGVVRVSGPASRQVISSLAGEPPAPRRASLRALRDPRTGDILDQALVLWFPGPASATGEDCAEFHIHGSRAVASDLLSALAGLGGCRPAEAGEFTRRAFETGRLDLTSAEGLADLIAAQTSAQRRQALRQSQGGLADLYDGWRSRLLRARALIEAELDFADEEDVPGSIGETIWRDLHELAGEMAGHLSDGRRGERLRSGVEVVILGPPNAGKSTLLNAVARRDAAIVTEEAGTTRDLIEVSLDLDGHPAVLVDTAGLRHAPGVVEAEGIRRARERAAHADLVLWLEDCASTTIETPPDSEPEPLLAETSAADMWRIGTKSDLAAANDNGAVGVPQGFRHVISVKTGAGLDEFMDDLAATVASLCAAGEDPVLSRQRHRSAVEKSLEALREAIDRSGEPIELRSEYLRLAGDELGRITGRIDVEDLLDVIFSEFCIGK